MPKNALGRVLPERIFDVKVKPFEGLFKRIPSGTTKPRTYQSKLITRESKRFFDSLDDLFESFKFKNGITVSFHHALRNGDAVVNQIMDKFAVYSIKDLVLASTALFPVHEPLIDLIKDGVIKRIEGSMNGPIGRAVSTGEVKIPTILRSHGGRARAVEANDLPIHVAFVVASASDDLGNLSGVDGRNQFGSMGYVKHTDCLYADLVIGVTDTIVDTPLTHMGVPSSNVDAIVMVDNVGDPSGIASGSLGRKLKPSQEEIAETVVEVIKNTDDFKNGFNWQAGAGGMSMAASRYLRETMIDRNVRGGFIFGGINISSVDALNDGLFGTIFDAQSFDLKAIESLRDNPRHIEVSINHAYNPFNRGGCIANYVDFTVLGATEVDINFNVNVNTYSTGVLVNGIGGHQDAANAKTTIITVPLARKVPTILEKVTTVTTPGQTIDVIVTDGGIAVNPSRPKLQQRLVKAGLPVTDIRDLHEQSCSLADPIEPDLTNEIVTLVEYRDGTHLDVIYRVND